MPQRLFPEVEQEVSRLRLKRFQSQKHESLEWDPAHPRAVVLCEPSGPSAESGPSVEPDDGCTVHLVGLGRAIIDPRDGALKAVGGACTFGTTVEMLLLEMQVPYVLHALDPDAKAAWYVDMFEKAFTPALYVGGGVWMQETADIVAKVLADHPERAVQTGLSERVQKEGGARWRGNGRGACAPVSAACRLHAHVEPAGGVVLLRIRAVRRGQRGIRGYGGSGARGDSEYEQQAGRCTSAAFTAALDTLVEKLGVLEEHLGRHAYCCGERMGVDDVMRFVVLQILFTNLGELWGMTAPAYARLPHVARWMGDMAAKDSNPFKYVHDSEMYYRAHRDWWSRRCRSACFPRWSRKCESLEAEVAIQSQKHESLEWDPAHPRAVVLCEPSGPSAESGPSVEPDDGCTVHLVGLGRAIIDPRDGALKAVGGACTFGTTVEMLLLEMQVPYVLHALDPDAKAAWYVDMFEKAFTPAMYVGGGVWMQETADIVAKVLADHPERAVQAGLSERVQKDGGADGEAGNRRGACAPVSAACRLHAHVEPAGGVVLLRIRAVRRGQRGIRGYGRSGARGGQRVRTTGWAMYVRGVHGSSGYAGAEAGCAGGAPGAPCVLLRRAHGCGRRDALRGAADLVHEPG